MAHCTRSAATRVTTAPASPIVASVPNMRPLDAGGLSQATPIESFTAVLLQLNVHYKTRVAVKFTGIPDEVGVPSTPPPGGATAAVEPDPDASAS